MRPHLGWTGCRIGSGWAGAIPPLALPPNLNVAYERTFKMRTMFDFTPYRRSAIGFDRIFETLENLAQTDGNAGNYPPYDIERTGDDAFRITVAVAGLPRMRLN